MNVYLLLIYRVHMILSPSGIFQIVNKMFEPLEESYFLHIYRVHLI